MSHCTGAPAEQWLEQYVAGTLPDAEAQAFEEHYFECPECLARLQALQAVAEQLRLTPAKTPARVFPWPAVLGTIGAIAAVLLIAVVGYQTLAHRAGPVVPAQTASASGPVPSSDSQLADLTLPPFQESSLRGEAQDSNGKAGMEAYEKGDCSAAVLDLAKVPARSADALSAQFYAGVCQLKLGQLAAAAATLQAIAGKGDSPQQEAALYYLAQDELLRGDRSGARHDLESVISLHGDFEQRAKKELDKLSPDSQHN